MVTRPDRGETINKTFEQMFDGAPDAIFLYDSHGHFIDCNPAASELLGQSKSTILQSKIITLVAPSHKTLVAGLLKNKPAAYREEWKLVGDKNGPLFVKVSASQLESERWLLFMRDITPRRQAEAQLIESEQRFRHLADTAPVLIWMSDPSRKAIYFNQPWLDFVGRELSQELGDGWRDNIHPHDASRVKSYSGVRIRKKQEFHMEFRLRRADGSYRWVLDRGVPRFAPNGELLGYIGTCIDIEDLHKAMERQRELELEADTITKKHEELVTLSQAKDEFLSLASHQLRTPATAVKQYVGMMLQGYAGDVPEHLTPMLAQAYESNERQLLIIDDMLRVAQVDAGKVRLHKEEVDLGNLIKQTVGDQGSRFAELKQTVKVEKYKKPVLVHVDKGRMHMVLENLIDNASKYSDEGKTINIKVVCYKTIAVISIKDQGVGIAGDDLPKLFQKFSRIDNSFSTRVGGTGLGLYWAKKIIDLHGGTIEVKSQLGKGTEFKIKLPI